MRTIRQQLACLKVPSAINELQEKKKERNADEIILQAPAHHVSLDNMTKCPSMTFGRKFLARFHVDFNINCSKLTLEPQGGLDFLEV